MTTKMLTMKIIITVITQKKKILNQNQYKLCGL